MSGDPRLRVSASDLLLDERFGVRLDGFPPGRRVTVQARTSLDGAVWTAEAVVRTDADGTADLDEQAPLAGTYASADAMGLVWSMKRTGDRPAWVDRPQSDGNVALATSVDGRVVATATVHRRFATPGVDRRRLPDPDLVAELFVPPGGGPHPGVLLLGGSSGGFPSRRAASLLASRGYAVLTLAYFGTGDLPADLVELPLEYVERAVTWLVDAPEIEEPPFGVVGWSRGGELALLVGTRFDRVRTVVGYAPSSVVFQGNALTRDPGSAWTWDGDPLPYVPLSRPLLYRTRLALEWVRGSPVSFRHLFERGLDRASTDRLAAATVPVEEVGGPVLLVTGDDDRTWPADRFATRAMARLDAHDYPHPAEHLLVPGAGHDIKVPFHPTTERRYRSFPVPGRPLVTDVGGTTAGYARADELAWERTLATLSRGLE